MTTTKFCCGIILLCATIAAQAQTFATLLEFDGVDGDGPNYMSLVQGDDGNYYGTTEAGGMENKGTIFKVTPDGAMTMLHDFCVQIGCADGAYPLGGLTLGTNGSLYGAASEGGYGDCGTIFEVSNEGRFIVLGTFNRANGCGPTAPPIEGVDGNFYGTTTGGGANFDGTVYKIAKGVLGLTSLHSFYGPTDGALPFDKLAQGTDGNLYGTASERGSGCAASEDCGTVFRITPSGVLTTLHVFCLGDGCPDGEVPYAGLVLAEDGAFYGTTFFGGLGSGNRDGTIFRIEGSGTFATLYQFCGCGDGGNPAAALVQATDGNLYGSTASDGSSGYGTLFKITPGNYLLTTVHDFDLTDGSFPYDGLFQATSGLLVGATTQGGNMSCAGGCGTVYSLDMGLAPFITFVQPAGRVGQTGGILGQGFTGTTSVMLNGAPASFTVVSDTYIKATVPPGATTGYVTVTTPTGMLTSNVPLRVIQ